MGAVIYKIAVTIFFLASVTHAAIVNRLNGGIAIAYADFSLSAGVVPLELLRSYSSLTALSEKTGWSGAFGWGWNSPIESTLATTADRQVLLRDGSSGNTSIFRPVKAAAQVSDAFLDALKNAYFERSKGKKLSQAQLKKLALPTTMVTRLKADPKYRVELAKKYELNADISPGEVLESVEYGYQTLKLTDNQWVREKSQVRSYFNKLGQLTRIEDRSGYGFDYVYAKADKWHLEQIHDRNKAVSLKFKWQNGRITQAVDNRGRINRYAYDSTGNLVQVSTHDGQTYIYKYTDKKFPHLLTKIEYVSESSPLARVSRQIGYDANGLVAYHKDTDGTEYTYAYGKSATDPMGNFWTRWAKKLPDGVVVKSYDEYTIRSRDDGTKYLYKQENQTGSDSTSIVYTMCCGSPQQVTKNGAVTRYKYYADGMLKERTGPDGTLRLEYEPRWKKVSRVISAGVISNYEYDGQGNLVRASNSQKQSVALSYYPSGQIKQISDRQGRTFTFKYGSNGRTDVVTEKGVGSIKIHYSSDGSAVRTEMLSGGNSSRIPSEARAKAEIVDRVKHGFQQLLDILRPVGDGLTVLSGL